MIRMAAALAALMPAAALADCPRPGGSGALIEAEARQLARAHTAQVVAGGTLDLALCAGIDGAGHVMPTPDFTLRVADAPMGSMLDLRTVADCDTILLVHGPGGWWHDDDGGDMIGDKHGRRRGNARLRLATGDAVDVWIGTFGPASCRARLVARAEPVGSAQR